MTVSPIYLLHRLISSYSAYHSGIIGNLFHMFNIDTIYYYIFFSLMHRHSFVFLPPLVKFDCV